MIQSNGRIQQKSKRQMTASIISSTVGLLGSSIFIFGLSFMLLEKTGSAFSFGLSTIVSPIVAIALVPIVGSVVDQYDRKKIILISQCFSVTALILYAFYFNISENYLMATTILLITVLKASDQFTSIAQQAAKKELVLPEHLTKLTGYSQTGTSISGIIATVTGAALYALLPFTWFILFSILSEISTFLISCHLNFKLIPSPSDTAVKQTETNQKSMQLFQEGLQYIIQQNYLFSLLLIAFGMNFFSGIFNIGIPIVILNVFQGSSFQYGLTDALFGFGMMIGGIWVGKMNPPKNPLYRTWKMSFVYASILVVIGAVTLAPISSWIATLTISGILFLTGFVLVMINVPFTVWIQSEVPVNLQGRVFNLINTVSMAAMPLGVFLYGFLFDSQFTVLSRQAFIIFLLSGLLMGLYSFLIVKLKRLDLTKARIIPISEIKTTLKPKELLQTSRKKSL